MKIKVFKNDYTKVRLCSLALASTIVLGGISGCGSLKKNDDSIGTEQQLITQKKVFNVGEHIISVPVKDLGYTIEQYEYHKGYRVVGIATSTAQYSTRGTYILYVNEYPVECHSSNVDGNGNYIYTDFGTPQGYYEEETIETETTKEFNPGEHIISIPIEDQVYSSVEYEYHEGYEPVGIATSYRKFSYDKGCILYVNTEKVTCTKTITEDGNEQYLTFGIPNEKPLTRTR